MENIERSNSCFCEGREFAHLEKSCQESECFVCKNGIWERDDKIFVL
jgi:hypothetical protein